MAEWLRQADYDLKTAQVMFDNRRYIYTVFMCHLAIEKALKGLYQTRLNEVPPRVHNLVFLVEKLGLDLPATLYEGLFSLNRVSVPTRYPDEMI
jgi:HEPN domain-containing protein